MSRLLESSPNVCKDILFAFVSPPMTRGDVCLHLAVKRLVLALAPVAALMALLVPCGCASGDRPLAEVDPNAVPQSTTYDQVFSIIQRECLPCHDRGGEEPPFDTCEHVVENFDDLFEQVFEKNAMPPGAWPRLSSEERLVLIRWNGEGPCTQ
jgi:uncharacterized membrane protein